MADNADQAGRGWAIAGAFAAQAVIFAGVAALLTGTGAPTAIPSGALDNLPTPFYTARPGQDLSVTLGVTIPATLRVTDVSVTLASTGQQLQDVTVYDAGRPLTPGPHMFAVHWTGSAAELRPGTAWSISMSANVAGSDVNGPIATVEVGS